MDIRMLMKCTEKVGFFSEMIRNQEGEKHEECCKAMGYKLATPGEFIVQEGTMGQTFYVILKGTVGIYKEPVELPGENSSSLAELENNFKMTKKPSNIFLKSPTLQTVKLKSKETLDAPTSFNMESLNKIKVLKAGDAFGELSLMENKPRAASVISEQECHLAILEKQYFDKILSNFLIIFFLTVLPEEFERKKLFKQIDFFASLKLFSSWSYNAVKNLYYLTSQLEFKKFMPVYKENDSAEDVFIIKSGEFKVLKTYQTDSPQVKQSFLMRRGSLITSRKIDICLLGPGEAFGEEEVIEQIPRQHTVVCNSISGTVFVIERKEFLKRVLLSQKAKKQLEEQINSKSDWREKRIDEKKESINVQIQSLKKEKGVHIESNVDPEEFAMIKGQNPREKNVITNIRDVYFNPFMVLGEKEKREKVKMVPVMENIVDPVSLVKSLKDKTFLRQMTANSPKRNFFILNNLIKQEKRKEALHIPNTKVHKNSDSTSISKLPETISKITEDTPTTVQKTEESSSKYNQIILPMSNSSINNYLKLRNSTTPTATPTVENEYQLNSEKQIHRKKGKKDSSFIKASRRPSANLESLVIEGKGSSDSQRCLPSNNRKKSMDLNNYMKKFLPLKYSSEKIKRKPHTPTLSLSSLMRKNSKNENNFDEGFLTSRHI